MEGAAVVSKSKFAFRETEGGGRRRRAKRAAREGREGGGETETVH